VEYVYRARTRPHAVEEGTPTTSVGVPLGKRGGGTQLVSGERAVTPLKEGVGRSTGKPRRADVLYGGRCPSQRAASTGVDASAVVAARAPLSGPSDGAQRCRNSSIAGCHDEAGEATRSVAEQQ